MSYAFEPFLPRRIPNIQHDFSISDRHFFCFKIHSYGSTIGLLKDVIGEAEKETGFSHPWVPQEYDLNGFCHFIL